MEKYKRVIPESGDALLASLPLYPLLFQGLTRKMFSPNDSIHNVALEYHTRRSRFIIATAREANLDREFRNCFPAKCYNRMWARKQAELSKAFMTGETLH